MGVRRFVDRGMLLVCGLLMGVANASAEPGSRLRQGKLDAGGGHACAVRADGRV